jgi:hypothetical protein
MDVHTRRHITPRSARLCGHSCRAPNQRCSDGTTPILLSGFDVSTTSLLWACRPVMDSFSGAGVSDVSTAIALPSLRFCLCTPVPGLGTRTCPRRQIPAIATHSALRSSEPRLFRPRDCSDLAAGSPAGRGIHARQVGTILAVNLMLRSPILEIGMRNDPRHASKLWGCASRPSAGIWVGSGSRLFEKPSDCSDLLGLIVPR